MNPTWTTARLAEIAAAETLQDRRTLCVFKEEHRSDGCVPDVSWDRVSFARAVLICSVCFRNRASDISGNAPHGYLLLTHRSSGYAHTVRLVGLLYRLARRQVDCLGLGVLIRSFVNEEQFGDA